ncbi:MAG: GNAT family N-acetyltransferase [Phenylobacterium sp.]
MCATLTKPVIATERLILRGPVREDAQRLAELLNDFNVAGMTSRIPHPYGPADAEAFLDRQSAKDAERDVGFVIEHRQFGLVGGLAFDAEDGKPELGYWLGRPFWNRGYATEAVRGALGWARRDWRRSVVIAGHFSDNAASGQVLCKAGFLYTGDVQLRPSVARGAEVPTRMMVWLA